MEKLKKHCKSTKKLKTSSKLGENLEKVKTADAKIRAKNSVNSSNYQEKRNKSKIQI